MNTNRRMGKARMAPPAAPAFAELLIGAWRNGDVANGLEDDEEALAFPSPQARRMAWPATT
jgi:hypothetical protein